MNASSSAPNARPLAGKHVLITRPQTAEQDDEAVVPGLLQEWGARVSQIPFIEVQPVAWQLEAPLDWDWVFFTSQNAVHAFYRATDVRQELRHSLKIAVVGPTTGAALASYKMQADYIAPRYDAESAARAFCEAHACQGLRVLWPCGNRANAQLADVLSGAGAAVTPLVVYQTVLRTQLSSEETALLASGIDVAVFASPSAVSAFRQACRSSAISWEQMRIACLGPKTAEAARTELGRVDIQPDMATMSDLAEAIKAFYEKGTAR